MIEGPNGSGKTSLFEAMHYLCYGRSFRTRILNDLIADGNDAFVITAEGDHGEQEPAWNIHVGGTTTKRLLKINNQRASSYKELMDLYRVVSVTEDDVMMVKGSPDLRRLFIDQSLVLHNHDFNTILKAYRHNLEQRNSALWQGQQGDTLRVWTDKLKQQTHIIQEHRKSLLIQLELETNMLLQEFIDIQSHITLRYQVKEANPLHIAQAELRLKRTLFGAHLDDIIIDFQHTSSRTHASRGQQKLIALMLKIAHLRLLKKPVILLLDDFLTDFDREKIQKILKLIESLPCQAMITAPLANYLINEHLSAYNYQHIKLQEALTPI